MAQFVIFGATGFTGKRIVRDLVAQGHSVRGVTRSDDGAAALQAAGAEAFRGDPNDRESIRGACEGAQYVIQCTSGMMAPAADGGERPYAQQVRNILDECARPGLEKYVWTGTTAVYGDQPGATIDESFPLAPANTMGEATLQMETIIRETSAARGIPAVILRVPGIVVPERAAAWDAVRKGTFMVPGDGSAIVPLIHVEDLATLCIAAALRGVPGEAYNLSIPYPASFGLWYDQLSAGFGLPNPARVPVEQLPPQARAFTPISMNVSTAKAQRDLGVTLQYPRLEDLVASVVAANPA